MEHVFFEQSNITVTNTRFIVGAQTYAIRNITSVKPVKYAPQRGGPVGFLLLSAVIALVAFLSGAYAVGVISLVLVGLCVFWLTRQRYTFGVVLTTSGGEVRAVENSDWPFIQDIVAALNESIMSHD